MPGVATIHYPLSDVYSCSGNVRSIIYIGDAADRTTMHSHSDATERITAKPFSQLDGTASRSLRRCKKSQRHSISGRDSGKLACLFRCSKSFGCANELIQLRHDFPLIVNQQL